MNELNACEIAVREAKRSQLLECLLWIRDNVTAFESDTELYNDMVKWLNIEIAALK